MKETDMASDAAIAALKSSLRGALIQPSDPNYNDARKIYNAMHDKKPRLIAEVADVADVIACVNFARNEKMIVAIQGGGHNAGGLGTVDDGLVIKLSRMKSCRVDPDARTVRVDGGCTWGDVDHATHAFGLAVPTGIISTTGVGGLTLGGGLGHLTRGLRLTIDNLRGADVASACPSPIVWVRMSCWPMVVSSLRTLRKIAIYSGLCAAAAETSAC